MKAFQKTQSLLSMPFKQRKGFCGVKASPLNPNIVSKDAILHLHTSQSFQLHSHGGLPRESPTPSLTPAADLPWGEIPFELNYDRKTQTTKLSNNITVTSIDYLSPVISISVFIACGSINERAEASGAAHFLEHMHFKGTPSRTKKNLELEIENQGAHLNAYTTRDYTSYILNVSSDKVEWGVELLSDILTRSVYNNDLINRERDTIYTELLECQREEFETILENSHYTVFKGHSIARPILGLKENIMSVTRDQIVEFHRANYTGDNILFTVAGSIEHAQVAELIDRHFGKIEKSKAVTDPELLENLKTPAFAPRTTFIDGPEGNLKAGVFWQAPGWLQEGYIPLMILQRIIGDYEKLDFALSERSNSVTRLSSLLSRHKQVEKLKPAFTPYKQTGLFGLFVECEPSFGPEALAFVQSYVNDLASNITDEDVLRARSQLFGELMMIDVGTDVTQDVGTYLTYLGRVVTKPEIAKRISLAADRKLLQAAVRQWLVNKPFGVTLWGPYDATESAAQNHLPWHS